MTRCMNSTFSIVSKSGKTITKEFCDYKEAQRFADIHFGKGCCVYLVSNSISKACSLNPVVMNALSWIANR